MESLFQFNSIQMNQRIKKILLSNGEAEFIVKQIKYRQGHDKW